MVDKQGIRHWCASVRSEFAPRGDGTRLLPETVLATALDYLQALTEEPRPEPPHLFRVWFATTPSFYRHVRANDAEHAGQVANEILARYPNVSLQILKITPEPVGLLGCMLEPYLDSASA